MKDNIQQNRLVPELRFAEFQKLEGWEKKPFSKLFKIGSGRDYKHLDKGAIPVYGTGGYMLSVNDFLYDGKSACIGRKGTINKPMFLSGKFWTVDTLFYTHSFEDCSPEFVYLLFQNINWLKYNEAGGVPSLSKNIINKIEVYIPTPQEQQKIAATLSSLDDLLQAETERLALLKEHKKGLLQQLFPKQGEKVPQLRFEEFVGDGDWEEKMLGDIAKFYSGGTPTSTNQDYYNGDIPFIGSGDISKKNVFKHLTQQALINSSAKLVRKGDILYALYGATSGEVAISKISGAINQAVLCIRTQENQFFLKEVLKYNKSNILSKYIQGGQGNLSADIIKKLIFKFPSIKEQQKIADTLTSVDKLIAAQAKKIAALKEHKKGLMQGMFPNTNTL